MHSAPAARCVKKWTEESKRTQGAEAKPAASRGRAGPAILFRSRASAEVEEVNPGGGRGWQGPTSKTQAVLLPWQRERICSESTTLSGGKCSSRPTCSKACQARETRNQPIMISRMHVFRWDNLQNLVLISVRNDMNRGAFAFQVFQECSEAQNSLATTECLDIINAWKQHVPSAECEIWRKVAYIPRVDDLLSLWMCSCESV